MKWEAAGRHTDREAEGENRTGNEWQITVKNPRKEDGPKSEATE